MKEGNTRILGVIGDWESVVDDCRSTVGKEPLGREPSDDFKRRILIAEHSPIRNIFVRWRWEKIKSWIATHFSRHKWECFIQSQRTDRTGIPRDELPQGAEVSFTGLANAQALIDTARKRLCYQASPETRGHMEDLKTALFYKEPEISEVLVPSCVYRGGCPEMNPCGYYKKLLEMDPKIGSHDIADRYQAYNAVFWGGWFENAEREGSIKDGDP